MPHTEKVKKDSIRRLKRADGQLQAVIRMIEKEKGCIDILTQLAAVRGAVGKVGLIITEEHIRHCIAGSMGRNRKEVESLTRILKRYVS